MIENETPRTRSLLRQASRNVEGGKFAAAERLYRQIVAETPNSAAAWLGLAQVLPDEGDKQAAYEQVLAIDIDNVEAKDGLARLRDEPSVVTGAEHLEEPAAAKGSVTGVVKDSTDPLQNELPAAVATAEQPEPAVEVSGGGGPAVHVDDHVAVFDPAAELFCYRHPSRSTSLRCYKCNKPICSECAVKTPVGYLCPDCQREAEDAFFNAKKSDYLLALLVALPVSLLAGWLVVRFSGGIFMILLFIFAGGAVGGFIARLAKRVMGNRRGRYIPHLVAACIIIGVMVWAWPWVLYLFTGNAGVLFKLAGIGVYLFTAASSAFYWAR